MSKLLEFLINKSQSNPNNELSVKEEFENQLNPMQQADWKVILGIRKKQMEEAARKGVPTESLLAQIIKPKGIFDKGGIEQDTQGNITGIRQSGIIPSIANSVLGQSGNPEDLLKQLLDAQKLQGGSSTEDLLSQQTKILENQIKTKQLEELNSPGGGVPNIQEMFTQMNIPENEKEDFQIKTSNQYIRGMVRQVPTLERKKTLPAGEIKDYNLLNNTHRMMKKNKEFLEEKGLQIGPGLSTRPGSIGDLLGQMKESDFNTWKASVGRSFDLYRKWITGAQASYKEIGWIAPNYPKSTDSKELFVQKSLDVMKDIEANSQSLMDNFSNGGYAVSKIRNGLSLDSQVSKKYIKTGKNKQGQRVGMLKDGSIEVINE